MLKTANIILPGLVTKHRRTPLTCVSEIVFKFGDKIIGVVSTNIHALRMTKSREQYSDIRPYAARDHKLWHDDTNRVYVKRR